MSNKKKQAELARKVAKLDERQKSLLCDCLSDEELLKFLTEFNVLPPTNNWWILVLKVICYAIGLILAGYGTSVAAQTLV